MNEILGCFGWVDRVGPRLLLVYLDEVELQLANSSSEASCYYFYVEKNSFVIRFVSFLVKLFNLEIIYDV